MKKKKPALKLSELKKVIDKAVKNAEEYDPEVEVWFGDTMYRVVSVGQFGIVPDVTIHIEEPAG